MTLGQQLSEVAHGLARTQLGCSPLEVLYPKGRTARLMPETHSQQALSSRL